MEVTDHYPAPLMSLLVDAIPALCKSKMDVLTFFRGAGVDRSLRAGIAERVRRDRESIGKREIARTELLDVATSALALSTLFGQLVVKSSHSVTRLRTSRRSRR